MDDASCDVCDLLSLKDSEKRRLPLVWPGAAAFPKKGFDVVFLARDLRNSW